MTLTVEREMSRRVLRIVASAVALLAALSCTCEAEAAKPRFAFGIIAGPAHSAPDETATQRLLDVIGHEQLAFVVYDGNLKGATQRCDDALYEQRQQVLQSSRVPLIFIPGQHDWADCDSAQAGGYDVTERLDFLRQTIFADNASLGQSTLALTRESEVARFHAYRENVRWQVDGTVFVGLNVVGGNNHYLNAGGRNGEYDDRAIATAFWLEHAAQYARRRHAHALVAFMEADPNFKRGKHAEQFSWLRFGRRLPRDGYIEFKRSLVKAAKTFPGPIVIVHATPHALPRGFSIDQPLYDDNGEHLANLTRIEFGPREAMTQWIRIEANFAKAPPFQVSVRQIPRTLPQPPAEPLPGEDSAPAFTPSASGVMPAPAPVPPGAPTDEPPLLPLLPEPQAPTLPAPEPAPDQPPDGATDQDSMQRGT
ncbi:MAG TPA: hypothetical protein VL598_04715 [Trinickia sp.]|uniref:hypothetical protein n=1 Tax=Trinickia sp. TaxID=2571163 RepID=UPI002C9DF0D2|nr:hypothetical protein [Trinickia sp.]HTI16944.1 hypothetical protein [Trinickia sp.]